MLTILIRFNLIFGRSRPSWIEVSTNTRAASRTPWRRVKIWIRLLWSRVCVPKFNACRVFRIWDWEIKVRHWLRLLDTRERFSDAIHVSIVSEASLYWFSVCCARLGWETDLPPSLFRFPNKLCLYMLKKHLFNNHHSETGWISPSTIISCWILIFETGILMCSSSMYFFLRKHAQNDRSLVLSDRFTHTIICNVLVLRFIITYL